MIKKKIYNIKQILKESSLSPLDTQVLLIFLLKKSKEFILTHPEIKITASIYKKFKILQTKRLKNWPIAYLIGQKEFYNLNFKVSPAVLTPRPETELIVEETIKEISKNIISELNLKKLILNNSLNNLNRISALKTLAKKISIVDLGTGSGAIIISIAQELKQLFPVLFKNIKFIATDISPVALNIAKQNVKIHRLSTKIKFYCGNLLIPLRLNLKKNVGQKLIITANLPYLSPQQIKKSPSISREPRLALDGGSDGLKYYRELFKQLNKLNIKFILLGEIDPRQVKKIKKLGQKYFPNSNQQIKMDLMRRNRLFIIN